MSLRGPFYRLAREVSPSYRRWRRIIQSSTFDPDAVASLESPTDRDFIICGSPRSGTALLTAMLWQPPRVVTVMEPWDALRLPPADLFRSLREEMKSGFLTRGRLNLDALEREGAVVWCRDRERAHPVTISDATLVGVKFPAFWRYLNRLPKTRFLVCLRDPTEVVRSYGEAGGRLASGLDYDLPFNAEMNRHLLQATDHDLDRRIEMYDYIHERMLPHLGKPNVLAIRYERWFRDPLAVLDEISGFLGTDLRDSKAVVRAGRSSSEDPRLADHVRSRCRTAEELGYNRER